MTICEPKTGGNILCVRLSSLGDVVHSLNALTLLRHHRPHARITWIVEDRFAGVLEGHPCIDKLLTVPRKAWGSELSNPLHWDEVVPELAELALVLRREQFDVSLDFQSSIKSAWLVASAGATLRVGFARPVAREVNWLVQNALVRVPRKGIHRIERDLALLAPLGIATRFAPAALSCQDVDVQEVERFCAALPRPLVVMHPGTSRTAAFKQWAPERYSEVADCLVRERKAGVVVTWGPGERELAERVVSGMKEEGAVSPELQHLDQLTHLLGRADMFIGSDTGPMHMASALQVPVVALFGPKDPEQTGPYCSRSVVVTAPVDCRPCTRHRCRHARCMSGITVEQVLAAARELLDGGGQVRAHEGRIRTPCAVHFEMDPWRGCVNTCYSEPDFYRWLCQVEAAGAVEGAHGNWERRVYEAPGVQAERLLVRRFGPRLLARAGAREPVLDAAGRKLDAYRCWRMSLALLRAGFSVRLPVCYMETEPSFGSREILIAEEMPDAVTLTEALKAAPAGQRAALIEGAARLVRRLHLAGFHHGGLMPDSILVSPGPRFHVDNPDNMRRLPRGIPLLGNLFAGGDLKQLLSALTGVISEEEKQALVSAYSSRQGR